MTTGASGEQRIVSSDMDRRLDHMQGRTTTGQVRQEQGPAMVFERSFPQSLVDSLPCSFFALDREGRFVRCNADFLARLEYSSQEIGSMHVFDVVLEAGREDLAGAMKRVFDGDAIPMDLACRAKSGRVVPLHVTARCVTMEGTPFLIGTGWSNVPSKPGEQSLTAEAYHAIVDHSLQGLLVIQDRKVVFANCAMERITGYSVQEIENASASAVRDFIHPQDREKVWRSHEGRLRGETLPDQYEFRAIRKDGAVRWLQIYTSRVEYHDRPAIQAAFIDTTERRRAEHLAKLQRDLAIKLSSLSDLKEGLQYCLEAAVKASQMDCGGIYMLDKPTGGLRLDVHVGLTQEFVDQMAFYPADSRHTLAVCKGEPIYGTYDMLGMFIQRAHKAEQLQAVGIIPVKYNEQVIACLNVASHTSGETPPWSRIVLETIAAQIGFAINRLETQGALLRAEQEKAAILNTIPQIVVYHDLAHRIVWANRAALEALGKPAAQIVGRPCYEVWDGRAEPCAGCPVDLTLRSELPQEAEIIGYNGGNWLVHGEPVRDERGRLIGVVEHALDITHRKRDEGELRRRLQFEELVAGISTDLANLPVDEVGAGIERALAGIGRFAEADRSHVYLLHDDGAMASRAYVWCAEGIDPGHKGILDLETCRPPVGFGQSQYLGVLNVPSVQRLQGRAAEARKVLESIGVKSLLSAPVAIGGKLFGYLGLSAVRWERTWPDDALQLLTVAAEILANAMERKRSAELMQEKLAFETLLSELSAAFINLPVGELDKEIERWLARVGQLLGIDRAAIIHISGVTATVTHSWVAAGLAPAVPTSDVGLDWSIKQLRQGNILAYSRIEDAPPEAEWEKEYCRRHGIQSIFVMSLEVAGSMLGIMMLSSVRTRRDWPEELIQRLRLVGQVFANAMLRRRAEEALRANEARLRSILLATPAGIGLISHRVLLEVNDRICEMVGYRREEFVNKDIGFLYPTQEEYEHVGRENARQIKERGEGMIEARWKRRDGGIIDVLFHSTPLDAADLSKGITFAALDITSRKKAETALRESEQNYREVFNAANDAVLIHDPATGAILDVNRTTLDIYGFDCEEMPRIDVGTLSSGAPPYTQQDALAKIHKAVEEGPQLFEWRARRKNGELFWQEVNLRTATIGGRLRVLAVARDITDRKKADTQAQQHLAELTRAWHANMLGEMASGLAHELNQPLCAIVNYANGCLRLTRRPGYSIETVKETIERIARQSQRAADIVKRIRGLIGRREPYRTTLDLERILVDAVYMLREEATAHNVAIISRLQPQLPKIKGDDVEIGQVVLNLMRNAMEAMNDPKIVHRNLTISSCLTDRTEIEIAVQDTGRGLSPELSKKIFDSFFTTKPGGLGIGLSLSRRIIEAHGGRLWVESDGWSGATFRFTLPVEGGTHGEG